MRYHFLFVLAYCCILMFNNLRAQHSYTLSGYISDSETGEALLQAAIFNKDNPEQGVAANNYGFYSLHLPEGEYTIAVSYLGYLTQEYAVRLDTNIRLNIELQPGVQVQEIVVTAADQNEQVQSTNMGQVDLTMSQVERLPVLMGEVDILKTLQLLPGVMSGTEGSTGFYVRGGGPDQNLVLLDEALIYNPGHMMGFFSVFNSNAIQNTRLVKGSMPARYGGRLSSVVDIQMKEGNNQRFGAKAGIGLVASNLFVEGPLKKGKSSFMVAGRRTYAFDLAQPFLKKTAFSGTNYYFYDLNAKANYQFSDKDKVYISGYFGRDVLLFNSLDRGFNFEIPYGNSTVTLRWNHLFSDRLFLNTTLISNNYDFSFKGKQADFTAEAFSGVRDYSVKLDFDYFPKPDHTVKMGVMSTWHQLTPNIIMATSGEEEFSNDLKSKYSLESGAYVEDDWKIDDEWTVNLGVRGSLFTLYGPFTDAQTGRFYKKGTAVKTYYGVEPRLAAKYSWEPESSVKAAWMMTRQYLHLVSNSSTTLPTDVWVPSSIKVEPQTGWQATAGWFHNFANGRYEMSVEAYYKKLFNQLDYSETIVPDLAEEVENQFIKGEGQSYGLELFVKKRTGSLTGWLGYTLSKTERWFDEVSSGEPYPQKFDRTHDIAFVMSYLINRKWDLGLVFVYGTGNAYTPIESMYLLEQTLNVHYGPRNSARIDPYHRLDLALTYIPTPKRKNFETNWVFSIYNVYNRQNPAYVFPSFSADRENGSFSAAAYKLSLFPIIPSISWNIKWNQKK